jgi:two-component system, LuxR family, response regulator FixJ
MQKARAHVLDSSQSRRAILARSLFDAGVHTEIYESIAEFSDATVTSGLIIAEHDTLIQGGYEGHPMAFIDRAGLPVSIYSEEINLSRAVQAILSGAIDYVSWPITARKLEDLCKNDNNLQSLKARELKNRSDAIKAVSKLTSRELEVLSLVVGGNSSKSAARILKVSPRTVEIHRGNAFRKINARSVADAVRIGLFAGLYLR